MNLLELKKNSATQNYKITEQSDSLLLCYIYIMYISVQRLCTPVKTASLGRPAHWKVKKSCGGNKRLYGHCEGNETDNHGLSFIFII